MLTYCRCEWDQGLQRPQPERLVRVGAITLDTAFDQDVDRGGEVEGRTSQVQHPPVAVLDVLVLLVLEEGRRQEVTSAAAADVVDRAEDVLERQVDEAVPAEDGVGAR